MTVQLEMAEQPMFDVVPCVGFHIDKLTPDEKYYDYGKEETHYSLKANENTIDFPVLNTFRTLETNSAFLEAKKVVAHKNMYITNDQYTQMCAKVGQAMGMKEKGMTPEQELAQQLRELMQNQQTFNNNPVATGVSTKFQYEHQMDQEARNAYYNGNAMNGMKFTPSTF